VRAAETGLIHQLAAQLLRDACAAAARWPLHIVLAVDLFPSQLKDRDLKAQVVKIPTAFFAPPAMRLVEEHSLAS
jgi:EAL domain-containing protein (putative c-di-GMP-specific phosphodiesterase class I)